MRNEILQNSASNMNMNLKFDKQLRNESSKLFNQASLPPPFVTKVHFPRYSSKEIAKQSAIYFEQ